MGDQGRAQSSVDAADLLSGLGKFHHFTSVWTTGRPSLYALWLLMFTATFKDKDKLRLHPAKQKLKMSPEAAESMKLWWRAVSTNSAPKRRMLPCNQSFGAITLDIFLIKELPEATHPLWVMLPSCWWRRPLTVLGDVEAPKENGSAEKICIFLETLEEGLEVMDMPTDAVAVVGRSNIYKLVEAINKDLYVKSLDGAKISASIHGLLASRCQSSPDTNPALPLELRSVLCKGGTTPHPLN